MPLPLGDSPRPGLRLPRRGRDVSDVDVENDEEFLIEHALDSEKLIDAAMRLGLICSVFTPPKGKSIKAQVGLAAKRADIVCLDWELHNDGGDSATKIIKEIVRSDEERNGRLRLIAIYTGDKSNDRILKKVFNAISKSYRKRFQLEWDGERIQSSHGLRIVCLFKAHGVQLADERKDQQVSESDLPDRLQEEFALLAGGVLSNVALATIAAIRNSTHHVLAKMAAPMDAPYFHHRAMLPMVSDAEQYSVDVILSVLKSAIDKQGIAREYAGRDAISARIREIANGAATMPLRYESKGASKVFEVGVDKAIKLVTNGLSVTHRQIAGAPGVKEFKRNMSSLFAADLNCARIAMQEFAVLTGVRTHPGNSLYKNGGLVPQLGLGTIVEDANRACYLCLQASCDSVRVRDGTSFLFVPLSLVPLNGDDKRDYVVPAPGNRAGNIGLMAPKRAYAQLRSMTFDPDDKTQTVLAEKLNGRRGLFFMDRDEEEYRWVADIKQRRALRTAQELGQDMSRLGFDEFEPFRRTDD